MYSTDFELCFKKANQTLVTIPHILIYLIADSTLRDHKT